MIDEINEVNALIAALHPTPAVCGMPKWDSMDFIVENESYDRGLYAGFWGPVNLAHQQGFQFYVNLRCVHWDGYYLSFFAGGGIVEDSNLDKEWGRNSTENEDHWGCFNPLKFRIFTVCKILHAKVSDKRLISVISIGHP